MDRAHLTLLPVSQQVSNTTWREWSWCSVSNGSVMTKRTKKTDRPRQRTAFARSASLVLQGRSQEIALIDNLIDRIDQGGSTLVISGEPGIGKSALLELARHRAHEREVSVLSMTGVLAEVHLPFAALEQALRPLMKRAAGLVPRQRSALLAAFGMQDEMGAPDIFLVALATLTLLTGSATRKAHPAGRRRRPVARSGYL